MTPLALSLSNDQLLAVAAVFCSVAGLVMTVVSFRFGRRDATAKAEAECHEKLLKEQRVSEELSNELHHLRMREDGGWHEHEAVSS